MVRRKAVRRRKLTSVQQSLWETLIFLTKVIALSIPLYLIILLGISLAPLQQFDATVSSGILRALGYSVKQEGASMTVGTQNPFSFYLTGDCTAWKSFLFLFALIFAVPKAGLRKRLLGLGIGIPILWLGNQARIVGVVLTEQATNVQFALFTHDYFWRVFLVLLVLVLWLAWMKPSLPRMSLPKFLTRKTKK